MENILDFYEELKQVDSNIEMKRSCDGIVFNNKNENEDAFVAFLEDDGTDFKPYMLGNFSDLHREINEKVVFYLFWTDKEQMWEGVKEDQRFKDLDYQFSERDILQFMQQLSDSLEDPLKEFIENAPKAEECEECKSDDDETVFEFQGLKFNRKQAENLMEEIAKKL